MRFWYWCNHEVSRKCKLLSDSSFVLYTHLNELTAFRIFNSRCRINVSFWVCDLSKCQSSRYIILFPKKGLLTASSMWLMLLASWLQNLTQQCLADNRRTVNGWNHHCGCYSRLSKVYLSKGHLETEMSGYCEVSKEQWAEPVGCDILLFPWISNLTSVGDAWCKNFLVCSVTFKLNKLRPFSRDGA